MTDFIERKVGELTVRVDRSLCIGSGNCVKVAGDLFVLDDEDIASFAPAADEVPANLVVEGCRICPVEALFVAGPDGQQLEP